MNDAAHPTIEPIAFVGRRDAILRALADFIDQAGLKAGDRLPAEREFMEGLRVGRSTIREAIRHLDALGIVEIRLGSGTYLKRPINAGTVYLPLSITSERQGLLQTLEVRRGLEVEAGALAALRATPAQLALVEHNLDAMEAVHFEKGSAGPEDLVFHLSIYEASGNPLFAQLLQQIREAFTSFFHSPFQRRDFASRSFPFHRELFEAIARHDPDAARAHTLAILAIVEEDILRMSHD